MFVEYYEDKKHLFIRDIQMSTENISKGYGTMAMEYLFCLVDKLQITRIDANQYSTDSANKSRQKDYYTKFGFTLKGGKNFLQKGVNEHPFK